MGYFEERQTLQWEVWYAKDYATKETGKIIFMVDIMAGTVYTIMIRRVI